MSLSKMGEDLEGSVVAKDRQQVEEPPLYKVLLHNDDYTTMEFVIIILQSIFHLDEASATEVMLNVHKKGIGVAGIYTREVAETKVTLACDLAKEKGHPLKCTMEKV